MSTTKKIKNSSKNPGMVGAELIGNGFGLILVIAVLLFAVLLPIILFATYYYTFNLVNNIDKKTECKACLSNEYMCDKVLKYTPIPLMVIMILNIIVF